MFNRGLAKASFVVLALCLAVVGSAVPAAAASTGKVAPNDVIYRTEYRGVHKTDKGQFSGDWTHCAYVTKASYHQTVSCSKGKTVTETVSGNAGYSNGEISAAVGFSVSYATTVTSSVAITINPGGYGWDDVGFRYERYTIGMEEQTCIVETGSCFGWSSPTTVTVQHHLGNTYHYFGTGAA